MWWEELANFLTGEYANRVNYILYTTGNSEWLVHNFPENQILTFLWRIVPWPQMLSFNIIFFIWKFATRTADRSVELREMKASVITCLHLKQFLKPELRQKQQTVKIHVNMYSLIKAENVAYCTSTNRNQAELSQLLNEFCFCISLVSKRQTSKMLPPSWKFWVISIY